MRTFYWIALGICLVERVVELVHSNRNQHRMKENEYLINETKTDLDKMILFHICWTLCLLAESIFTPRAIPQFVWLVSACVFSGAEVLRAWVFVTLGRFWNISVMTPNDQNSENIVTDGPYRWIRHPNYLVVILELFSLPLLGGAVGTALFLPPLFGLILSRRLVVEEQSLLKIKKYAVTMGYKPRFFPRISR